MVRVFSTSASLVRSAPSVVGLSVARGRSAASVFFAVITFLLAGFDHGAWAAGLHVQKENLAAPGYRIGDILASPDKKSDPCGARRPTIRLLVTKFAEPNSHYPIVGETVSALQAAFGADRFEAVVYTGETSDIENADLVLSSAGTFARMRPFGARDLATVVSNRAPDPNHAEGTLFATLKSRTDINKLEDLRGKRISATGPNAFAGYHVGLGEVARTGKDPDTFFGPLIASGYDMRLELSLLRQGLTDAVMLRTCLLEELAASGEKTDDLKPIHVRNAEAAKTGACLSSTDTYPNWTLFATPRISPENARLVAQTLLSMKVLPGGIRWSIANDFTKVDDLYRALKLGPYEYLRTWTWTRFWERYQTEIVVVLVLVFALILHAYRSSVLVERRTAQLQRALKDQREAQARAQSAAERVETLRRAGAVGQMSAIIAHELRQPVATVRNYVQGLRRTLDTRGVLDADFAEKPLLKMDEQTERIERIIEKVRTYGKSKESKRRPTDVVELTRKAVETLQTAQATGGTQALSVPVLVETPEDHFVLVVDPLEWELCVQNLVKNACEAAIGSSDPRVLVRLSKAVEAGRVRIRLSVEDNGPVMTEAAFTRLSGVLSSTKLDGLGLGLSIVRMIVEDNGGVLCFERKRPRGLVVSIEFARPLNEPDLKM